MTNPKKNLYFIPLFLVLFSIGFTSCKKETPILEDDQEEIHGIEVLFTPKNDPSNPIKVTFNQSGSPDQNVYSLSKNQEYLMELTLFHHEEIINHEIEAEPADHQFFFFAPENSVSNYQYLDEQIGLSGEITFGENPTQFDLKVTLRHGLNKNHPSTKTWNSPDYLQAGGVDDLVILIPISLK